MGDPVSAIGREQWREPLGALLLPACVCDMCTNMHVLQHMYFPLTLHCVSKTKLKSRLEPACPFIQIYPVPKERPSVGLQCERNRTEVLNGKYLLAKKWVAMALNPKPEFLTSQDQTGRDWNNATGNMCVVST